MYAQQGVEKARKPKRKDAAVEDVETTGKPRRKAALSIKRKRDSSLVRKASRRPSSENEEGRGSGEGENSDDASDGIDSRPGSGPTEIDGAIPTSTTPPYTLAAVDAATSDIDPVPSASIARPTIRARSNVTPNETVPGSGPTTRPSENLDDILDEIVVEESFGAVAEKAADTLPASPLIVVETPQPLPSSPRAARTMDAVIDPALTKETVPTSDKQPYASLVEAETRSGDERLGKRKLSPTSENQHLIGDNVDVSGYVSLPWCEDR